MEEVEGLSPSISTKVNLKSRIKFLDFFITKDFMLQDMQLYFNIVYPKLYLTFFLNILLHKKPVK